MCIALCEVAVRLTSCMFAGASITVPRDGALHTRMVIRKATGAWRGRPSVSLAGTTGA